MDQLIDIDNRMTAAGLPGFLGSALAWLAAGRGPAFVAQLGVDVISDHIEGVLKPAHDDLVKYQADHPGG